MLLHSTTIDENKSAYFQSKKLVVWLNMITPGSPLSTEQDKNQYRAKSGGE